MTDQLFKQLAQFLRESKDKITKRKTVCVPRYSHTYGDLPYGHEEIEYVDVESLLKSMDEFGEQLRAEEREKKHHSQWVDREEENGLKR